MLIPSAPYSQFVKMDDGDIYLFYRHGSHRSDWVYQKSSDNCRTFAPPVSLLKHKAQESDPNMHDAWYAWFEKGRAIRSPHPMCTIRAGSRGIPRSDITATTCR